MPYVNHIKYSETSISYPIQLLTIHPHPSLRLNLVLPRNLLNHLRVLGVVPMPMLLQVVPQLAQPLPAPPACVLLRLVAPIAAASSLAVDVAGVQDIARAAAP